MSFDPNFSPPPPEDPMGGEPPPTPPPSIDPSLARTELTDKSRLPRNIAAFLAVLIPLISGVFFYIIDRRDRFVRHFALQNIVLGGFFLVIGLILRISAALLGILPFVGHMFVWAFNLTSDICGMVFVFFWLILMYKAYRGQTWETPILWRYAKQHIPQALL